MAQKTIPKKVMDEVANFVHTLRADNLPIHSVYVYGSYAKGKQRPDSDIDVCVVSSRFASPWRAMQYLWSKRLSDSGLTIEPVGFNVRDFKGGSALVNEIRRTGVRVV